MKNLDSLVAQRLTRYYIAALTAVGLLSLSGQILVQYSFSKQLDDSRVINIAGRQRMLSQRLTKQAVLFVSQQSNLSERLSDFGERLEIWRQCHEGLRNGQLIFGKSVVVPQNSAKLDTMFRQIEPSFRSLYAGFGQIEQAINGIQAIDPKMITSILKHEQDFLNQMDAIVFQYDTETKQRVDRVRNIDFMITVITFVVLLLEGLFVFRPIVEHTQGVIWRLMKSETDLQQSNESLQRTQETLLRTTEEKYQLQLAEETIRTGALLEGQERERGRLSREIHDGIGQMLTALKLHTEKLGSTGFATEKQQKNYEELRRLVIETIEATRSVSFNLMPSVLSDFGVEAAIRLLAEQAEKSSGVPVLFEPEIHSRRFSGPIEIGLYRVTQEALHNAIKHAKAQEITIGLFLKNNTLQLVVSDNGVGFKTTKSKKSPMKHENWGSGLNNMRTRVRLLGGECTISSKIGTGTKISVTLPITDETIG